MKLAVNIVGYVESEDYDRDTLFQMLNQLSMKDQFKPIDVVEIIVQEMKPKHSINKVKVSRTKLSQA